MIKIKDKKIRNELLSDSWNKLNENFPKWKKNVYIKKYKNFKNLYMKTVNKITFKIYSFLLRFI